MARTLSQGAGEDARRTQDALDLRVAAAIADGNASAPGQSAAVTQQPATAGNPASAPAQAPEGGAVQPQPPLGMPRVWANVPPSVFAPLPAGRAPGGAATQPGAHGGGQPVPPGTIPAGAAASASSAGGAFPRGPAAAGASSAPMGAGPSNPARPGKPVAQGAAAINPLLGNWPPLGFNAGGQPQVQYMKVTSAPPFKGTDYNSYNTWVHKFKAWAQLQGLWEYYQHEVPAPTPTRYTPEELAAHVAALQLHHYALTRAYGELLQCLELDEHVQLLIEFQGDGTALPRPDLARARLESIFTRTLPTSNLMVTRELSRFKLREGETIMEYWTRGRDLKTRHAAAFGPMSLLSWLTYVLAGLDETWEGVTILQTQILSTQSEEGLLNVLLEEEDRRRSKGQGGSGSDALNSEADFADGKKGGSSGGKWGKQGKGSPGQKRIGRDGEWGELGAAPPEHCHGCHLKGHAWRECRRRPGDKVPSHLQKKKGKKAGQKGKAKWPKRPDASSGEGSESSDTAEVMEAEAAAAKVRSGKSQPSNQWVVDSGASYTFTPYLSDFSGPLKKPLSKTVRVGDGTVLPIQGMGEVRVRAQGGQLLTFTRVHYVPGMHSRLLSVPHLLKRGARVVFDDATCKVYRGKRLLIKGEQPPEEGSGLFRVTLPTAKPKAPAASALAAELSMQLAHQRLTHAAPSTIAKLAKQGSAAGFKLQQGAEKEEVQCEPCLLGKAQRLPFPKVSRTRTQHALELVHVDLWGPARVPTLGKHSTYVLSILDHHTSYQWAYLLRSKESAGVQEALSRWLAMAERQSERKLKVMRTDNGTEFKGAVDDWLRGLGVQRQFTVPYSPQQNGRIERWHRTMGEGIRTMLLDSGLPGNLWGESLSQLTLVKNRIVHSALNPGKTPYEMWFGRKPDLSMLKRFGCMCSSLIPEPGQDGKLSPRGKMLVHLGLDEEAKGWRVMDPETLQVTISRNPVSWRTSCGTSGEPRIHT